LEIFVNQNDRLAGLKCRRRSIIGGLAAGSLLPMLIAGCSTPVSPDLPRGPSAYAVVPPPSPDAQYVYKIGPLDILNITVFQEPDLSFQNLPVDASGSLSFPLIGDVRAEGKTTSELAHEIAARLGKNYLINPQVTVVVVASQSQHVTVEGNVTQPGVYDINGPSTLLQALALARSPTRTAKLDQVVIFRVVNGQRMGAVFDVNAIRAGAVPDPEIRGGDVVVVGFSGIKGAFRDFLQSAGVIYYVFRAF
jgi:polysaccharide export outer membrane protein